MSASASSRNARSAGRSSTARGQPAQEYTTMPSPKDLRYFDPCASTASMFLYAQGSSIVCCHHDTLTIDRRFTRHGADIQLLAVDNQSQVGGGRLVVSYDASQAAVVWDLMTGDEIARFVSYDHITSAAWMRNGNVAFGNSKGNIILFEPTTSEHISSRTIDQIAVTAIAPSADCRTFAIGYQNGSLLIATLQPRFTILHNLTTSRGPSPIVTLSWHASSPKQKADMLAVQTHDGDLRVWSVAKNHNTDDPAKVIRILRRSENLTIGPNWMGWSKNGRIIQYSDSETRSWDVRTKHITSDDIPTLEHVRGLALYGPGATLFTVGPNGTVQQFDLNSPSIMVANVQHPVSLLPPSPPNSIEEANNRSVHSVTTIHTSDTDSGSSIPLEMGISESDEDHLSPFARIARHRAGDSGNEIYDSGSPVSSRSNMSSAQSKSSTGSKTPGHQAGSMRSKGMSEHTYISAGSSLKSSTVGKNDGDNYSMGYSFGTTSVSSMASSRARHRPSRLRHEVPRSPDESSNKVHDLFKFTRTRLSDIPYKHPIGADKSRFTNDDLRRQMLSTIFGWHNEVEDLIRDEMSRHAAGSPNRILLAKWLGEFEADVMETSAQNMTSSDWMMLALSGIGGNSSQQKLGRTFVQRLLETGDVHVAVTIMLGMGDQNDAIEIYVSHKRYMEALILTCMVFPGVWERQAAIIRKWGEWAVQHGQQQLAIRCFACTDQESSEPWRSPSAAQLSFSGVTQSIPEVLSPPLSPPGVQRGPQRSIAKSSALKLITSFGEQSQKSKFYSQGDGGQTPIAAGITPIAESAVSPGGYDPSTAFIRPSNNSRFNTPTSARPGGRGRLPSIGEIPSDLNRIVVSKAQDTPTSRHGHSRMASGDHDNLSMGNSLQRAATASPMMMRQNHSRVVTGLEGDRPPSPDHKIMLRMQEARENHRNGSRDRIPRGINLQLEPMEQQLIDTASTEQSGASSARFHWPTRRRGPGSVASSITSTSSAGRSYRQATTRDYQNNPEPTKSSAQPKSAKHTSKERTRDASRGRHGSKERRTKSREPSQDRGRASGRSSNRAKRSPTSPIPMSPEDLANLTPRYFESLEPNTIRKVNVSKTKSRTSSRSADGRRNLPKLDMRSRSQQGRDGPGVLSPTSPVPLSASILHYQGSEDEEDLKRAMLEQEAFRVKHSRSASRGLNSPAVSRRERSESRRREAAESVDVLPPLTGRARAPSLENGGDLRKFKDDRQRKKDLAARELEDRRRSLAKRSQTPQIPHPSNISLANLRVGIEASDDTPLPEHIPPRCATEPPKSMYARTGGQNIGLPATPKAMRLVLESHQKIPSDDEYEIPGMPLIYGNPQPEPVQETIVPEPEPEDGEPLLLLPSTVYQPPTRPMIPRSMSAPIPDDPPGHPRYRRKGSLANNNQSKDDLIPPPPPPAPAFPTPPMLRELQHLAIPPPPPPAPLPHARGMNNSQPGGAVVEILMEDDEEDEIIVAAPNDGMVPVLSPPAPPSRGHHRGRSIGEGSISGHGSKAAERMRSASRTRKEPPPIHFDQDAIRSPIEPSSRHTTGLNQSDMF